MDYRREIDGLRAVAVLPVILFHAGFSWFSGGYVGVDVFFVISGYLITSILMRELELGKFSIVHFYERRARRILPALYFVMLCCIPFAWFWMVPEQFRDFAQGFAAIVLFLSNFLFWWKEDYFAPAAEENPLLHTWTLAVEEQFYVFFPLLLLALWCFGKRPVFYIVILLSLISLFFSEWASRAYASANFYLLPTRAWELGVGAVCAFILHNRSVNANQWLSGLGLMLLAFAMVVFDESTPFPSLYALVPVIGTAMIILFADSSTRVARLLSGRFLVGIGLISYSAYLWHQPLFAFARIRLLDEPEPWLMLILSGLSLALAYFSWKYVEQPFRHKNGLLKNHRQVFAVAATFSVGLLAFAVYGHITDGAESRIQLSEKLKHDLYTREYQEECFGFSLERMRNEGIFCELGAKGASKKVALVGDSHALSFLPELSRKAEQQGKGLVFSGISGCPPAIDGYILYGNSRRKTCAYRNEHLYDEITKLPVEKVILVARWSYYTFGDIAGQFIRVGLNYDVENSELPSVQALETRLHETFSALNKAGIEVVVFHQAPVQHIDARDFYAWTSIFGNEEFEKYSKNSSLAKSEHHRRYAEVKNWLESVATQHSNVQLYDFSDSICPDTVCLIGEKDRAIYYDDHHLSGYGAQKALKNFEL